MTQRGNELHAIAERQIAELIDLLSKMDEATFRLPFPGREKLGDGTVAASARHTADNYRRIAEFVQTSRTAAGAHPAPQDGGHRVPRFLRPRGHGPASHARRGHGTAGQHDGQYTAEGSSPSAVVRQLSDSRNTLGGLAKLTDAQLDTIPPDGSFRFCDGRRSLEQVLRGLLRHLGHQVDALGAAT